jgi:hypothetical protein
MLVVAAAVEVLLLEVLEVLAAVEQELFKAAALVGLERQTQAAAAVAQEMTMAALAALAL